MCDTCGCHRHAGNENAPPFDSGGAGRSSRDTKIIKINETLLKSNEEAALNNRKHFDDKGILTINLISSPGSGKTTLLEKTIDMAGNALRIGVLEGDIETDLDAERIRKKGIPAVQITTGGACHLDSVLVHDAFHSLQQELNGRRLDVLFIENVGNLVCPSFFNLGEHVRAVLVSVPEGHDKPIKYPKAFMTSHIFIVTKADLVSHFDFDVERVKRDALALNPSLNMIVTSAKSGEGLQEWVDFLLSRKIP